MAKPSLRLTTTQQALALLCDTRARLAGDLGVSAETVRSYGTGRRGPSEKMARALAALMRRRARALAALAERIERNAMEG
jgi:DNA-binding XRE family transcriptional regulator